MFMIIQRPRALIISLLAMGVLVSACRQADQCSRGDMTEVMGPALRDALAGAEYGWMRDAKVCTVGQYVVIGPAGDDDPAVFVMKGREGIFARGPGSATLYRNGRPLASFREGASSSEPAALIYDVRDDSGDALITVLDRNLDGQADLRTRHLPGRDPTIEVWHEDRWRTMVREDGRAGFIQDGKFVPFTPPLTEPGGVAQ